MQIRNGNQLLSLPANQTVETISNRDTRSTVLYAQSVMDIQILDEVVKLLASNQSQIEILERLKLCNSGF